MAEDFDPNLAATVYGSGPAQPARTLGAGDSFAGRYEVLRQLGAGGMGLVYLVRDTVTGEEIALKLIHPSYVDDASHRRLVEEGLLARRVSHPNVVRVFDVGESDGQVFLTMEYVDGRPLRAYMARQMAEGTEAPVRDVMRIVREILAGLAAAHGEGLVHRDIKPENIIISGEPGDPDFRLKILDFGIAKGLKTTALTGSQGIGAPLYMAPEQATTPAAVGPSADIYSVGRMLYEMLMDVLPDGTWNAPSEQRTDVPQALDEVIRRALQPPRRRFQSVAEFTEALDAAFAAPVAPAASPAPPPIPPAMPRAAPAAAPEAVRAASPEPAVPVAGVTAPGNATGGSATPVVKPKPRTMRWVLIGAAVLALIVVAAVVSEFEGGGGGGGGLTTAASDRWIDEAGNVFQIRRDGNAIEGEGSVPGWGTLRFQGALNGSAPVINASGQQVGMLTGTVEGDPTSGHWNGMLQNFADGQTYPVRFHINHAPQQ